MGRSLINNNFVRAARALGAFWAILGVTLILGSAVLRVLPHAEDAFRSGLSPLEWVVLIIWSLFMLVGEGYRGFQKQFSPRVAARMWHLLNHGRPVDLVLAPLYCVGYFRATNRRVITSWTLTAAITLIIVIVHYFPQPWRGILDTGVVLGLLYGLVWVYVFTIQTLKNKAYLVDPEIKNFTKPKIAPKTPVRPLK